jgi:ComF family protein
VTGLLTALERFLLPNACVACRQLVAPTTPNALCCGVCRTRMARPLAGCPRCQEPIADTECRFCSSWPGLLTWSRSAVWLGPEARAMVHHLKYAGHTSLAGDMAWLIRQAVERPAGVLIPVPLAPARERQRGYNQAARLAEALAQEWNLQVAACVRRVRDTASQTGLTPAARRQNVAGGFRAVAWLPPTAAPSAIIVDDVLTTGATVVAVAEALGRAGWKRVGVVTFARAEPFGRRVMRTASWSPFNQGMRWP